MRRARGKQSYRCILPMVTLALGLTTAGPVLAGQSSAGNIVRKRVEAIRIDIAADRSTYPLGKELEVTLQLVDPYRKPIKAPKDFDIVVTAAPLGGAKPYTFTVRIKRGDSSKKAELEMKPPPPSGAVQLRAAHPELLDGGTVIYIAPKKVLPVKKSAAEEWLTSQPRMANSSGRWAPGVRLLRVSRSFQDHEACTPTMIIAPTRPLRADGNDWAEVTIVEPVTENTRFFIKTTLGTLSNNVVEIPAGEAVGKVRITSDGVGEATISCVDVVPALRTGSGDPATVRFRPPVMGFELDVTPPRVPWVDRARIVVTLIRAPGTPVATDELRPISLQRQGGSGEIHPEKLEIQPGEFEARATFTPYEKGPVKIVAMTPDFPRTEVGLEVVSLPVLMFVLPILGGLCGGLAGWWRRGPADQTGRSDSARNRTPAQPPPATSRGSATAEGPAVAGSPSPLAWGSTPEVRAFSGISRPPDALPRPADSPPVEAREAPPEATETAPAASRREKPQGPLVHAFFGLLAGVVLHWAFVFDLVPAIPRAVVMNQFSWFVLPVLGGWLGAEVFDILLKRAGVMPGLAARA